jgi:hypothetical protein
MVREDEEALICDLAETYQIYDYERLPLQKVASFAVGLRDDSRIKLKLSGQSFSMEKQLLIAIFDQLNLLIWSKTEDAEKGINRPRLLIDVLEGRKECDAFDTGKDFESRRQEILRQMERRDNGD